MKEEKNLSLETYIKGTIGYLKKTRFIFSKLEKKFLT